MKRFCIFTVIFLLAGICSIAAQDLIITRDGSIIEARVMEISPTEIRYKRFEHFDGPTIVIPAANVLSIRYENGSAETIIAAHVQENVQTNTVVRQENVRAERTRTTWERDTALNPDKFIFGVNVNPIGVVGYIDPGYNPVPGWSLSFEFGKSNFNSEINLMFPRLGFGFLATFNGFWHNRIGGGYFGGGIGYSFFEYYYDREWYDTNNIYRYEVLYFTAHSFTLGLNGGYKFVTKSGVYFRTGAFVGVDFGFIWNRRITYPVYIKPDFAIGWIMR